MQMKAETATKIKEAWCAEEGRYGLCFECGEQIAHTRLRALPFAVRCKDCEEASRWHSSKIVPRRPRFIGPRLRDARLIDQRRTVLMSQCAAVVVALLDRGACTVGACPAAHLPDPSN